MTIIKIDLISNDIDKNEYRLMRDLDNNKPIAPIIISISYITPYLFLFNYLLFVYSLFVYLFMIPLFILLLYYLYLVVIIYLLVIYLWVLFYANTFIYKLVCHILLKAIVSNN